MARSKRLTAEFIGTLWECSEGAKRGLSGRFSGRGMACTESRLPLV
jgi:hypothetical protein